MHKERRNEYLKGVLNEIKNINLRRFVNTGNRLSRPLYQHLNTQLTKRYLRMVSPNETELSELQSHFDFQCNFVMKLCTSFSYSQCNFCDIGGSVKEKKEKHLLRRITSVPRVNLFSILFQSTQAVAKHIIWIV